MKRMGFTLNELLVVIAIIALLAAILFPVFAKAREKARQISCASTQRQIGLGVMQYVQDYDENYPMLDYNDGAGQEVRWYDAVGPYIKNGAKNPNGYYSGGGGIWHCPSFPSDQPGEHGAHQDLMPRNRLMTPPTPSFRSRRSEGFPATGRFFSINGVRQNGSGPKALSQLPVMRQHFDV